MSGDFEMTEKGIDWIGDVPDGWVKERIGSIYSHRNVKVSDKDYPPLSVTMKGIVSQLESAAKTDDHESRKLVKKGDFVINSRSDRRGSCGISDYDGSVSLINTVLTPRCKMIPEYYNWLFHTNQFADEFYKNGHGIVDDLWTTRWDEMKKIIIPIPTISEQTSIACYLNDKIMRVEDLIIQAKDCIEDYRNWRNSIVFEAVTKGIDANVDFVESGVEWIGTMPVGWDLVKLKFFIDILPGYAFPSEGFSDEGIPLLRGINVIPDGIRWEDVVYWNDNNAEYLEPFALKAGDVVMGMDRPWINAGTRIAIIQEKDLPAYLLQRVCRIRAKENANIRYIKYCLSSECFKRSLATETTGISVPHISVSQIQNFTVAMPNLYMQERISDYLDNVCAQIDSLIVEKNALVNDLEAYKKALIYEIVTGKRKVE